MRHSLLILVLATPLFASAADPVYPDWWIDQDVVESDAQPPATTDPGYDTWMQANYAPALVGQAKHMAEAAYLTMEAAVPGTAGTEIASMIAGFSTAPEDNYVPLNLGQLKFIAEPFYNIFHAANFPVVLADGTVIANGQYPWNPATPVGDNYAPANLGQLKYVFSFDLTDWPPEGWPPPTAPVPLERSYVYLTEPAVSYTVVGATVDLEALAAFVGDTVDNVEFFVDAGSLGTGDTSSPYEDSWTPGSAGTYTLNAVATATGAATVTSGSVVVMVEADSDTDGLGDAWETSTGITSPTDESDGDGLLASDEYGGGYDPNVKDHPLVKLQLYGVSI